MKWCKHLYLGEKAENRKYRITSGIRLSVPQRNVYVIVLVQEGPNLLEIYPSFVLCQNYYKKQEFIIAGIAWGYQESQEVVRRMIHDVYFRTGGFDLRTYFGY